MIVAGIVCLMAASTGVGQVTHGSAPGPVPASASGSAADPGNRQAWLRDELAKTAKAAPAEIQEDLASAEHSVFSDDYDVLFNLLVPVLQSRTAGEQAAGLRILLALRVTAWAKETLPEQRLDELTLSLAPGIMDHGDLDSQKLLAQALGAVTTEQSRAILWKMVQRRLAYGQALICLTWIGEARDLPRLAAILSSDDPSDPDGRERSSLCSALHSNYGAASIPFLNNVAQQGKQDQIRAACTKEVAANPRK